MSASSIEHGLGLPSANLFVFLDAHQPWRHVKVTERKTAHDFAQCLYELAE